MLPGDQMRDRARLPKDFPGFQALFEAIPEFQPRHRRDIRIRQVHLNDLSLARKADLRIRVLQGNAGGIGLGRLRIGGHRQSKTRVIDRDRTKNPSSWRRLLWGVNDVRRARG
jgi:hypothetical protein